MLDMDWRVVVPTLLSGSEAAEVDAADASHDSCQDRDEQHDADEGNGLGNIFQLFWKIVQKNLGLRVIGSTIDGHNCRFWGEAHGEMVHIIVDGEIG